MAIFISFDSFDIGYFVQPCNIPCNMQHVVSTPSTYPGSCKTCFSHKPVLIGQYALWSLPTAVLDDLFSSLGGYFDIISHSWLLNFIETRRASFDPFDITNWNYSTWSVMPKPVSLLTVQEAHKEYSSLTDQIRAKYKQLDSGEFGSPGTPAFDAEACESANLLARVSQLCQTEPANAKGIVQAHILQALKTFFRSKHRQAVLVRVWRMQLCSHRYVRITGLLSAL